jgi:23S rRNA (pseudouridine1915-N3)-methyltransferase
MKISLFYIGRSEDKFAFEAVKMFEKRIKHYLPFKITSSGKLKAGLPPEIQKETEGKLVLKFAESADLPVLLDVKGSQFTSGTFSGYLQSAMNRGTKHLGFIIGGSYGFSDEVYRTIQQKISLSPLTFSHQLVRLVFIEQLYRALTILNGEPYHHI